MRKLMTYLVGLCFLLLHWRITLYNPDLLITFSLPAIGGAFAFYFLKDRMRGVASAIDNKSARRFLAVVGLVAYIFSCVWIALHYINNPPLILAFCLPIILEVFVFYFGKTRFENKKSVS